MTNAGAKAVDYTLDPEARIVHVSYTANPTFEEWAVMMLALFRERQYAPGWKFLSDRRPVTEPPPTHYMQRTVAFVREHQRELAGALWATVVGGPAVYGVMRMGQALAADLPLKVGVFTDIGEAREWLARGY